MGTMAPPMAIPAIRVDGHAEQDAGQIEDLRWSSYDVTEQLHEYQDQQQQPHMHAPSHHPPHPPFKLVTDLPNLETAAFNQHNPFTLNRYVEDHQFAFHVAPQSAPVRELSPLDGCTWMPEPASAITQFHDRLSSPDETILSSTSGSNYWPGSTFSSRYDGVSCSSASQGPDMSRRGSAFGSVSAASDMHDPFAWTKNDTMLSMPETQSSQAPYDINSLTSTTPFSHHPTAPPSATTSRHATPFNTMFSTDMELECSTRASSIQPAPQLSTVASISHSHSHSQSLTSTVAHASFRYPSPHGPIRQSLTPSADSTSDFDPPKSDNDADSDYVPNRSLRSPRSQKHRTVRSTGHIRGKSSYSAAHGRSSSYNASAYPATSPGGNRVTKRPHHRQPSSGSHIHFSPKPSSRHNHAPSLPYPIVHPPTTQAPRPFTCPLTPYACPKTFTSKNEWKRHVLTQHLLLGFWRCDLCPDAATRPNDFNRKDLFVQHLRRMHCGDRRGAATVFDEPESTDGLAIGGVWAGSSKEGMASPPDETTEQALERVRKRCWIQLRRPPRKLACTFCSKAFESAEGDAEQQERDRGCSVEWLEHVGRHLVAMSGGSPTSPSEEKCEAEAKKGHRRKKSGSKGSSSDISVDMKKADGVTEPPWESDELLLTWLVQEGLVEQRVGGGWVLVDRGVASEAAMCRREERDAKGDVE